MGKLLQVFAEVCEDTVMVLIHLEGLSREGEHDGFGGMLRQKILDPVEDHGQRQILTVILAVIGAGFLFLAVGDVERAVAFLTPCPAFPPIVVLQAVDIVQADIKQAHTVLHLVLEGLLLADGIVVPVFRNVGEAADRAVFRNVVGVGVVGIDLVDFIEIAVIADGSHPVGGVYLVGREGIWGLRLLEEGLIGDVV